MNWLTGIILYAMEILMTRRGFQIGVRKGKRYFKKYAVNKILSEVSATEDEITNSIMTIVSASKSWGCQASHILVDEFEKLKKYRTKSTKDCPLRQPQNIPPVPPGKSAEIWASLRGKMVPNLRSSLQFEGTQ